MSVAGEQLAVEPEQRRILRLNTQYFPYRWDALCDPEVMKGLLGDTGGVSSISLPSEHPQYQEHVVAALRRSISLPTRNQMLLQLFPEVITPELLACHDTIVEGKGKGSVKIIIDGVSVLYDYALQSNSGAWIQPMGVGYEHLSLPDHDGIHNPELHRMIFGDRLEAIFASKPEGFKPFASSTKGFFMNLVDPRKPKDAVAVYRCVRDTLQQIEPTLNEHKWAKAVIADVKRVSDAIESLQGRVLAGMSRSLGSLGDLVHENLTSAQDLVSHNARSPAEKVRSKTLETAVEAFAAIRPAVVDYFMQPIYGQ